MTQTARIHTGEGRAFAISDGVRKIPEPIVALQLNLYRLADGAFGMVSAVEPDGKVVAPDLNPYLAAPNDEIVKGHRLKIERERINHHGKLLGANAAHVIQDKIVYQEC